MKRATYVLPVLLAALLAFPACGKKKLNLAKWAPVCAQVARCSAQSKSAKNPALAAMLSSPKNCQKFFAKMDRKSALAPVVTKLRECLMQKDCSKVDVNACFTKAMQGSMPLGM